MATKPKHSHLIWAMEYYTWAARIEKEWDVLTRLSVRHTPRHGVLNVYVEVWTMVENRPYTRLVRNGMDWPNSNTASYDTQVLGLLGETEARLEEAIKVWATQSIHPLS